MQCKFSTLYLSVNPMICRWSLKGALCRDPRLVFTPFMDIQYMEPKKYLFTSFFYERTNPTKGSQSKQQQQLTVNNVLICAFIRVIFVLKNDEYEWLTFQF